MAVATRLAGREVANPSDHKIAWTGYQASIRHGVATFCCAIAAAAAAAATAPADAVAVGAVASAVAAVTRLAGREVANPSDHQIAWTGYQASIRHGVTTFCCAIAAAAAAAATAPADAVAVAAVASAVAAVTRPAGRRVANPKKGDRRS